MRGTGPPSQPGWRPAASPPDPRAPVAERFTAATEALLRRAERWSGRSWRVRTASGTTREEALCALVQALADLAADAEGRPRRPVPALGGDALPDQVAVMCDDLLRTGSERAQAAGLTAITDTGLL